VIRSVSVAVSSSLSNRGVEGLSGSLTSEEFWLVLGKVADIEVSLCVILLFLSVVWGLGEWKGGLR
jgi:hypothetical protein